MTFSLIDIWFPMRAANALPLSVRQGLRHGASTQFLRHQAKGVPLHHLPDPHDPALALVLVTVGRSVPEPLRGLLPFQRHPDRRLHRAVVDAALRVPRLHRLSRARRALRSLCRRRGAFTNVWPACSFRSRPGWFSRCFFSFMWKTQQLFRHLRLHRAIIVLLLWLYLSATMMIGRPEFNSVLMEIKCRRPRADETRGYQELLRAARCASAEPRQSHSIIIVGLGKVGYAIASRWSAS